MSIAIAVFRKHVPAVRYIFFFIKKKDAAPIRAKRTFCFLRKEKIDLNF
jgi:hypothetical protein